MSRRTIGYLVLLLTAATVPIGELEAQFFDASCRNTLRKCKSCLDRGNTYFSQSGTGTGGGPTSIANGPCAGGRAGGLDHREVERLAGMSAVAWAANGTQIRALLVQRAGGGLPEGELLAGLERLAEVGPSQSLKQDLGVLRQAQRELNAAAHNSKASAGAAAKASTSIAAEQPAAAHALQPAVERAPVESAPALKPELQPLRSR